ncbi:MAG: class I SAM-dependent methyltransferase [Candidatus Krumholzibacteriota bacterium]|nr:class I SAM-dependent methyltransferase [Candidatus Krumholzibacteriota bacterium]
MTLAERDLQFFDRGGRENDKFWKRLGEKPDFTGAAFLDVGCGHGRMCVDIARAGAGEVVGLDTSPHRIQFAGENLRINHPDLRGNIEFLNLDLKEYESAERFDYIISKDAFEHIIDLAGMLREMKKRLKPGGKIYVGFGPLYNSYRGDHKRTGAIIPWGHLLIPERILLSRLSKKRGHKIDSVRELGLNKLSLRDYRDLLDRSGLKVGLFKVNCGDHPVVRIFSLLGRIPGLKEYFSFNLYCILQKVD